ncbi:MAG: UDP-N-acetylmuramoyl-tripeptide--D-alanyl-D-alanine ligase [Bacillota bacterium]
MKASLAAEVLEGRLVGNPEARFTGVSLDSRGVRPGELFVALRGQRTDGHLYLDAAFRAGATVALVEEAPADLPQDRALVVVPGTLLSLGTLAGWHRGRYCPKVVGLTGSVGKTTTKGLLAACLEGTFSTLVSPGNYNTESGVPMTLFGLDESVEVCVLEMAMRGTGQIAYLGRLARHDTAVITNIGSSHIEILGSMQKIAEAKAEVLLGTSLAVLNRDDLRIRRIARGYPGRVVWFGQSRRADFFAGDIETGPGGSSFFVRSPEGEARVRIPLPGTHNVMNALAALAAAVSLGVPLEDAARRLGSARPLAMRWEILEGAGITVINDAYNSSPASASAALESLFMMEGRRVAVLGDMLELGHYARRGHRQVGKQAARSGLSLLVTVGPLGRLIGEAALEAGMAGDQVVFCHDRQDALAALEARSRPGDVILVKASRRLGMEHLARALVGGASR